MKGICRRGRARGDKVDKVAEEALSGGKVSGGERRNDGSDGVNERDRIDERRMRWVEDEELGEGRGFISMLRGGVGDVWI